MYSFLYALLLRFGFLLCRKREIRLKLNTRHHTLNNSQVISEIIFLFFQISVPPKNDKLFMF